MRTLKARKAPLTDSPYIDSLMQDWGLHGDTGRISRCVRKVLSELCAGAHLVLRDSRLEVRVVDEHHYTVWAYFPVHQRRWIAKDLRPKLSTRVLLVFSRTLVAKEKTNVFEDQLRHHFGHVLLYLRAPRAPNECEDAHREWKSYRGRGG